MTLVEAGPNILGTFDKALVQYYDAGLKKRGINVLTSTAVTRVDLPSHAWICVVGNQEEAPTSGTAPSFRSA